MTTREQRIAEIQKDWDTNPRWKGIKRGYTAADVERLRGSVQVEYTLAKNGAAKLWERLHTQPYVNCLGALTGGQAMQQVKAGIQAIYLSGWQVAADNNEYSAMFPDQSLYPVDSVPKVVERINNAFTRADEIQHSKGVQKGDKGFVDYFAPIVADAEAGFGGVLNAYELMKAMIRAGAGGVHFEDQLASVKKCGHMGGKVLVPTQEAVQKLIAARMAADVYGVPTLVIARTDAEAADLLTSDYDENDKPFLTGERTAEGFYKTRKGIDQAISRAIAYADYGVKLAHRIWNLHASLLKPFTLNTQAKCWLTTARRRSTGRRTWTMQPSPNSSANWAQWATNTSSSPWLASTTCGTTCSIWRKTTLLAACRPTLRRYKSQSSQHATVATPSYRTSKKWALATSTRSLP
jgi:isocitrate lyase